MAIITQETTQDYAIYNADCMAVLPTIPANSVHITVHSPPFPELYAYSNDPRDMSNCTNYEEGMNQYRYVAAELARVTMPGRMACVHCMDLKKGQHSQRDFPGDIIRIYEEAGFHFFSRITIWKDPWLVALRTRMRSLQHKMIVLDSSISKPAGPDYLLVFKKAGENAVKITHPTALSNYAGERTPPENLMAEFVNYKGDPRANRLSHWIWRQYASAVWMDIRSGNLMPYREARESDEEKHVCPLQLDVIERCITLWSNPGETLLTPFMGVGSEVYQAVKMGRKGVGIELKETYFRQASKNIPHAYDLEMENNEMELESINDEDFDPDGGSSDDEYEP